MSVIEGGSEISSESTGGSEVSHGEPREDVHQEGDEHGEEVSLEEWQRRYELLLEERRLEKEEALRLRADTENLRKRLTKEKSESSKYALEGCLSALLPCLDSLEQALSASSAEAQGAGSALVKGVQLVQKQLLGALEPYGLEKVLSYEQPFDPECHQAVRTEPSSEVDVDTVVEVYQNGYRMHERLLRPAMVRVLSAQASPEESEVPIN